MRFALLFPVAFLAGFAAAAGPIRDEDVSVSSVGGGAAPAFDAVETPAGPEANAETEPEIIGDDGESSNISKREEFNPLEERGWPKHDAVLILCYKEHCKGRCFGYNLNKLRWNKCYKSFKPYHSVYVSSKRGLGYGVYVAKEKHHKCRGVLVPHVRTCYNVKPFGDAFFKHW